MMGAHHAMTGAAAWIAVTATASHGLGLFPVSTTGTIAGALLCAGAALLPDADHSSATIAHSVPLVGKVITSSISKASGGHRHGLHCLLAIIVAWLLSVGLGFITWQPEWWFQPIAFGPAVLTAASIAFAAKALKLSNHSWLLAWIIGFAVACFIAFFAPNEQHWFVLCVTLGYGVHLIGDFMTTGGLPLLWPWVPKPPKSWKGKPVLDSVWAQNGYMALPILGNAGSFREWLLLIPIGAYVGYGIIYSLLDMVGVDLEAVLVMMWATR